VIFYAVLTVVTALALAVYFVVARRQKVRPPSSQA
jgi:hypothetical protein